MHPDCRLHGAKGGRHCQECAFERIALVLGTVALALIAYLIVAKVIGS